MIDRDIKLNIISDLESFPAVAILGPRQVGKTSLARSIIKNTENALYLDLERPSDLNKLQDAEMFLSQHQDKMICFDEIQLRPDLFPILRSLIDDDRRPGRFMILGSSSPELLRQSSETLAGRIAYNYVTPFSTNEVSRDPNHQGWRLHLWRGGFPDSFLAASDDISFRWRENYVQSFLERDLRQFGFNLNPMHMRRLWTMCAHSHGQTINYSKFGQSLDKTHPTIISQIDILESTFMVRRLSPFLVNTKKRMVKSPKIYLRDTGIFSSLLGLDSFDALYSHPYFGASWEGYCIEQILNILPSSVPFGFFRTQDKYEIDLVVEHKLKKYGFEFKASSSPKIGIQIETAFELAQLDKLFVVVPEGERYPLRGKQIEVISLQEIVSESSIFNII